jgi:hypothetical protein
MFDKTMFDKTMFDKTMFDKTMFDKTMCAHKCARVADDMLCMIFGRGMGVVP